jgi:Transcriptional regulator
MLGHKLLAMDDSIDADSKVQNRFHTRTFERTDALRRDQLLGVALREFADKGFNGTSINNLARKAGVSIGSLYSYFPSKEDLFLTIVMQGQDLLEKALSDIEPEEDLYRNLRTMIQRAHDYALSNPELNRIYIDATTHGLRHLSARLSTSLESISVDLYKAMLRKAQARGEIRADLDVDVTAFCLDNLFILFQFSFASDYYTDRLRLFLGIPDDKEIDEDRIISGMLDFIRRALMP